MDARFAEAFLNRGNAWNDKGNLDGAIADYTSAIGLEPGFTEAYFNRGLALYAKGNFDQAIKDLTTALEKQSNLAEAHYYRALAWVKKWEASGGTPSYLMRALSDAKQAATLAPENKIYQNLIHQLAAEIR